MKTIHQLIKNTSFGCLFLFLGTSVIAQTQLGGDIDGEAAGDQSGFSVSLSSDSSIVAIGAPFNDGAGTNAGHVRVYQYSSGAWSQLGADIDGEAVGDGSGYSVSLSSDGSIVAIGAYFNDGNGNSSGHVRVYQYSSGAWSQLGGDIDGEAAGDRSGYSVSLSSDGSIVAIGAYLNDGAGTNAGHVRVYQYSSGAWSQLGADIDGEAAGDQSGSSVSLSADGSIVAIGAPQNNGNGSNSGHVRVYQYSSGAWSQLGADIDGEAAGDGSGYSVSLSADGSIVAIGAYLNDGTGSSAGHVRVYQYSSGAWSQLGADIDGEAVGDLSGYSVSLSSDGSIVAIGAPPNTGNGNNAGHVRVYQYSSGAWSQLGADIDGEAAGDQSGYSVSLSADGSIVAIGAPFNDGNGSSAGHVRVYTIGSSCADTYDTISPTACNTYTSPSGKVKTTTQTFNDTIANAGGCDSVITINLTINLETTSSISPDVCDSYTSPSGKVKSSTETFNDTIPNAASCDSVITINLTIRNSTYDTITQTAIDTFTLAGGTKVNTSGTYMDTIANDAGCDSITTYYITITNRIHVDHTVSSSGTGDSWSQAFKTIDEALTCVNMCNSEAEIWVRAGTYTPSNLPHGNRNSTFLITNINTQLLGGFNGTETASSQRNPATNTTILSGDIGVSSDATDNLFHVLIIQDKRSYSGGEEVMNSDFTVDGFTISGGNANGGGRYGHNGMFVYESVGAGVVIISQGAGRVISPKISNCVFTGNYAFKGSAIYARVNGGTCGSTYENCIFESNSCTYGTVHNDGMSGTVSPTISNCVFNNNTCRTSGGGIYSAAYAGTSSPTIQNCVFSNNVAANGGAIFNNGYNGTCSPSIINCTFYNNSALSAGAVYNFGGSGTCVPTIKNCIFSQNSAAGVADFKYSEFYNYLATPTISYSSLQRTSDEYSAANLNSLNSGSDNIFGQDPSFTSTTDLDGSDDTWRTADDGLMPASGSPVINAGTTSGAPTTDIRGAANSGNKDMGAYEVGGVVVP